MKKILITDSLFIFKEHEKMLTDAGYEIERLDIPQASEDQLITAIKGKVGYILGGTERVTEKVINAADELKVIAFTGIGYKDFIPAWEYAAQKGITIVNAPDGPTHAVAEWAITLALAMNRGVFDLGRGGEKKFMTTRGLEGQHIGIIGLGRIGKRIAEMLPVFNPASISYYSKHQHMDTEHMGVELTYKELPALLSESDVTFLCVSDAAGKNFMSTEQFLSMKNNSLLVSFMHQGIIDENALLRELESGRIRAVSDYPAQNVAFQKLPLNIWYSFNGSNAFNTMSGLKATSDMTTQSILNILETGEDQYKTN